MRAERRTAIESGTKRLDPGTLAPDVRRHLLAARAIEERIRDAIERAELPYEEVSTEVDSLVTLMELSASRAQLLFEALEDSPPSRVAGRLMELEGLRQDRAHRGAAPPAHRPAQDAGPARVLL